MAKAGGFGPKPAKVQALTAAKFRGRCLRDGSLYLRNVVLMQY